MTKRNTARVLRIEIPQWFSPELWLDYGFRKTPARDALIPAIGDPIKGNLPFFVPPKQKAGLFLISTVGILDRIDKFILYDRAHRYIIDLPVR
jgi:hypothetical protein